MVTAPLKAVCAAAMLAAAAPTPMQAETCRLALAFALDVSASVDPTEYRLQLDGLAAGLRDPAVRWAYDNSGATRWSEIDGTNDSDVSAMAKEYGLKFGAVVCCSSSQPKEQRSYGTFARADREFSEQEISQLFVHIKQLHELAAPPTNLTVAELEALKLVKDGMRLKVVAHHIGVTEGAIKQRLASAKRKLRAKTNTHAASIAVEFRLI